MADRPFATSFNQPQGSDEPGLVLGDDNVVYLITPDGTRVAVSGGGGSRSATASVTTDPATFTAAHTFDLGVGPHVAQVIYTLTATHPDGETFGTGLGDLGAIDTFTGSEPGWKTSLDGLAFTSIGGTVTIPLTSDANGNMSTVGQQIGIAFTTLRYLELSVAVVDDNSGAIYAGANHPTVTVRFDVVYL